MLIVAPNGIENDERFCATPIFSVQKFIVKGIVAVLLPIEAGIGRKLIIFLKNGIGEIFPRITRTVE